ncbi:S9 family peptidase [Dyadobacter fanqingshengii]|uniref:Prolyl oligopeptidase family serine peptidase n=1 Tax=Dyadobacter fanqingshengii TaxID=2906443 RepID=A0A9X1PAX9_9BACT|nr:prolyl oligopeptidase family serine peptidase [Dyadobacter fanqingshengii]MCF0041621.1 prolyl oligopeptidase family serine peptidase [Dyadobacter fanqingshengii]USJ36662.1 prolyl oligopeptidase family serine peptidase [Dyadobacter fanqingshengii]
MHPVLRYSLFAVYLLSYSLKAQTLGPLTVEKIMRDPKKWIGTSPTEISWSEDSKTIYFNWNPDKNAADSLYGYDLSSKKTNKIAPADRRTLPAKSDVLNKQKTQRLYEKNGDIFLISKTDFKIRQLTNTLERESAPTFSGDDQKVIFTRGMNLFSISLDNGLLSQLTDFKTGTKKADAKLNDQEKFLKDDQLAMFEVLKERKEKKDAGKKITDAEKAAYPKEIYLGEKNVSNQEISPDGRYITYRLTQTNKSAKSTIVPNYVTESGFTEDISGRTKVGAPDSDAEFWVYNVKKDTTAKVSVKNIPGISDKPDYLKDYPRLDTAWKNKEREVVINGPFWSDNGKNAVVIVRSLDAKDRWIMALEPETLTLKLLDRQRDEAWIGGPGIGGYPMSSGEIGFINDNTIYFQSEETGYSHLYSLDVISSKKTALTSGKFEVQHVDLSTDKKTFYLITNEVHPGEQHFYSMPVTGGQRLRITQQTGAHEVTLSPDETKLAIRYSQSNAPWELFVMDNPAVSSTKTTQPEQITKSVSHEFLSYSWRKAKVVTIKATDGQDIYARVYEPKKSNGKAVIFVHGAGYLQNAHKWWSQYFREYMFNNMLVDKGYTVLDLDYRASSGYGRKWRTGIYRFMGGKDLTDNTDGAKWLIKNYGINPKRIGIYGGSYGGFITLMGLFTTPDIFAAGAALRPVTDWAAYNHPYTANILNEPQSDSLAYRKSSPIYHAAGLKNHLLMCHGMVDVNVHYQDVVRLSQRLIELGKNNWELASYPMEDHAFVEASSWTDEYKRILKLFEEKL